MSKEYIERGLAIEQCERHAGYEAWSIANGIEAIPAADVVEVKHGRCDYCKDGTSFIGAKLLLGNDGKWHRIEHCPNCGAKMDGGC